MGLSRRRPVGGLRLRGATDDGPPPLLRLLDEACKDDELVRVTERAKACARKWGNLSEGHGRRLLQRGKLIMSRYCGGIRIVSHTGPYQNDHTLMRSHKLYTAT